MRGRPTMTHKMYKTDLKCTLAPYGGYTIPCNRPDCPVFSTHENPEIEDAKARRDDYYIRKHQAIEANCQGCGWEEAEDRRRRTEPKVWATDANGRRHLC